ncbi:hypothetical protein C1I98_36010, partial [Spongiactinospora gelatinilytica]
MNGEFELSLFMISDWRIGTGTGRYGYLHRLVQRDAEGTAKAPGAPIVPAKTLVGVWRDSCELAAHALDSGSSGVWHDWLAFLFGGQYATGDPMLRPAALVLNGPLRLPDRLTGLLRDRPSVAWAATFRKPGVAIDPVTGTAQTEMLRFEEMARAGVTLSGRGRIEGYDGLDPVGREAAVALLMAGARLLEGIGGKRRRGAGRCRLTIDGLAGDFAILGRTDVPAPPTDRPFSVEDRPMAAPVARPGWETVNLTLTVEQPVLAAATVQGNLVEGADHIPGWCLMPEVARRLGGAAHALVRTGDLVVTAATPQTPDGERSLPVPKVLVHAKGAPARPTANRMAEDAADGKQYRKGFIAPGNGTIIIPGTTLRMHNTIDDDLQRPTRAVGGVYIYRALAAGTVLRAQVRVRAGALPSGWERRLNDRWRVGRSSKDDYGRVRVEAQAAVQEDRVRAVGGVLRVWLLSDLLVRDARLRPSTEVADAVRALEAAFAKAGAPEVRLTPIIAGENGRVAVAVAAGRTESWHRGWGLPRSTLYGLAQGSCLTIEVTGRLDPAVLAEVR